MRKSTLGGQIVLLSADGVGTNEIMRRTSKSKTCVWQKRFMQEGFDGLLRDKTCLSCVPPLGEDVAERIIALTLHARMRAMQRGRLSHIPSRLL